MMTQVNGVGDMDRINWISANMKECHADCHIIFTLDCVCCGETYRTFPAHIDRFLETEEDARVAAYRQAIDDFSQILTRCLVCGRYVCNRCVVIGARGHLCKDCAEG